jgi:hypothetical protein
VTDPSGLGGGREPEAGRRADERYVDGLIDRFFEGPDGPEQVSPPRPSAPGPDGRALAAVAKQLRALPLSTWDEVAPVYGPVPGGPDTGHRHRRRQRPSGVRRPSALEIAVGLVAAVSVVVAVVVGVLVQTPRPPSGRAPVPASWRISTYLPDPSWTVGASLSRVQTFPLVTCPTTTTCLADDPGGGPGSGAVEVSADGGATWRTVSLPPGTLLTTGISCQTTQRCFAGGESGAPPGTPIGDGGRASVESTVDGGSTWSSTDLPGTVGELTDLACGTDDCVVAGLGPVPPTGRTQGAVTAYGPAGPGDPSPGAGWSVVAMPAGFTPAGPEGLSCSGPDSCVLGGRFLGVTEPTGSRASAGAVFTSTDGGKTWSAGNLPPDITRLGEVDCLSPTRCEAIANSPAAGGPGPNTAGPLGPGVALSTRDGGTRWAEPGSSGLIPLTAFWLTCTSSTDCSVSGRRMTPPPQNGVPGVIESTVDGGASWSLATVPTAATPAMVRATGLTEIDLVDVASISCPSPTVCVALGTQDSLTSAIPAQVVLRSDG